MHTYVLSKRVDSCFFFIIILNCVLKIKKVTANRDKWRDAQRCPPLYHLEYRAHEYIIRNKRRG